MGLSVKTSRQGWYRSSSSSSTNSSFSFNNSNVTSIKAQPWGPPTKWLASGSPSRTSEVFSTILNINGFNRISPSNYICSRCQGSTELQMLLVDRCLHFLSKKWCWFLWYLYIHLYIHGWLWRKFFGSCSSKCQSNFLTHALMTHWLRWVSSEANSLKIKFLL